MAIPEGIKKNFETVLRAADDGHLALIETTRKSDGKPVYIICAVWQGEDGNYNSVPFGEMCDGNPYLVYNPPCPDCKLVDENGVEQEP